MNRRIGATEFFGYRYDDVSSEATKFWSTAMCPFDGQVCSKTNHDRTTTYGLCTLQNTKVEVPICYRRLLADDRLALHNVVMDAFGPGIPLLSLNEYRDRVNQGAPPVQCAVALSETTVTAMTAAAGSDDDDEADSKSTEKSTRLDWCLVFVEAGMISELVIVEVQSMDITGNYRSHHAALNTLKMNGEDGTKITVPMPKSEHGFNWANVRKRLGLQLVKKAGMLQDSSLCKKGLYVIIPEEVFKEFPYFHEVSSGKEPAHPAQDVITVMTYRLGPEVETAERRNLESVRTYRVQLDTFTQRFIQPEQSGVILDAQIKAVLGPRA